MRMPAGVSKVSDIPDDYQPPSMGTREEVIGRISARVRTDPTRSAAAAIIHASPSQLCSQGPSPQRVSRRALRRNRPPRRERNLATTTSL